MLLIFSLARRARCDVAAAINKTFGCVVRHCGSPLLTLTDRPGTRSLEKRALVRCNANVVQVRGIEEEEEKEEGEEEEEEEEEGMNNSAGVQPEKEGMGRGNGAE